MNFFENQDRARKHTFWLVIYFILAIILIVIALDIVAVGATIYLNPHAYYAHSYQGYIINQRALINLAIQSALLVSPIIVVVILLGTLLKMISLREGGIAVAKMVNATEISPTTTDFLEKRFINVVEEMSIAAGMRIPKLYVMEETAINAFVAGIKPDDTVMVVTRGALQHLSRDELQGVVGHEFSHIFNSDMQISIKLMGILGGLLLLGQLGYFLLRILGRTNVRSTNNKSNSSSSGGSGSIIIAILIIGVGLLAIGYIGLFFGRLIKAAVARQRELLADASSVQYTRNPQGIIFALRRIQQSETGTYLATKNVEDISHLCFCTPRWILFQDLLATHPPLERRIDMLDPQKQYVNLPLTDPKNEPEKKPKSKSTLKADSFVMASAVAASTALPNAATIKESIGNLTPDSVTLAAQLIAQIPKSLKEIARTPEKVALLLYALILSHEKDETSLEVLNQEIPGQDLQEIVVLSTAIKNLPKKMQLPLLDIALVSFKANSLDNRQKIYQNLQKLTKVSEKKLFQFMLITLISKASEDKLPKENKVKYTDFKNVIHEISLLIVLLLKAQTIDEDKAAREFEALIKIFTEEKITMPSLSNTSPVKLAQVLNTLNLLSPLCKEKLIHVLLKCVTEDNIINLAEAELIRVIAASLDCPIAPLMVNSD